MGSIILQPKLKKKVLGGLFYHSRYQEGHPSFWLEEKDTPDLSVTLRRRTRSLSGALCSQKSLRKSTSVVFLHYHDLDYGISCWRFGVYSKTSISRIQRARIWMKHLRRRLPCLVPIQLLRVKKLIMESTFNTSVSPYTSKQFRYSSRRDGPPISNT